MRLLRWVVLAVGLVALPGVARAFCGFYVGGAGAKLWNEASQVVLVRHGTMTVLSMQNHYDGPPESFAMVVPVPVVLKKEDVKTLPLDVFADVDKLSAPRLVEYWEADPCRPEIGIGGLGTVGHGSGTGSGYGVGAGKGALVTVEAQFEVGEYDIVILSAKDSTALDGWLKENHYKIPDGAEPFLRPYVQTGMKFFVAKVDVKKVKRVAGRAELSPLRIAYASESFSLPIRLGLINSRGVQDLIVYLVGETRFELANRPNVTIPTNIVVKDSARKSFGELYAAIFDSVLEKHPGAAVTEYAWAAQSCDPCPGDLPYGLPAQHLMTLGGDLVNMPLGGGSARPPSARLGNPTLEGELDKNIVRRYLRQRLRQLEYCYLKELTIKPALAGTLNLTFTITASGGVTGASAEGLDPAVAACVADVAKRIVFPKPPGGGKVKVTNPLVFMSPAGGVAARPPAGPPMSGVVLTRLHLRYGKDAVGEDLVFRQAAALNGGTGLPDEHGRLPPSPPTAAGGDTFQGRYVILHPWTGKVTCPSPQRGAWGGPLDQGGEATAEPARDLAFVKRGALKWRDLVVEGLPAELAKP